MKSQIGKKIKIYIASGFENKQFVQITKNHLEKTFLNVEITSNWAFRPKIDSVARAVSIDYGDIEKSDVVLVIYPFDDGVLSEMGYALGKGILLLCLIDRIFFEKGVDKVGNLVESLPIGKLQDYKKSGLFTYRVEDKISGYIIYDYNELISCLKELPKILKKNKAC